MFETLFILQLVMFGGVLRLAGTNVLLARASPSCLFFVVHAFFYYLLPQACALVVDGRPALQFPGASSAEVYNAQILVLATFFLFYVSRSAWAILLSGKKSEKPLCINLSTGTLGILLLHAAAAVGLICLVWVAMQFRGIVFRSEAIATLQAQILFAGSLLCHFYVVLIAYVWHREEHPTAAWALIIFTTAAFFFLGGRIRAILVVVYFLWLLCMFRVRLSAVKLCACLIVIPLCLPIWSNMKGISVALRTDNSFAWGKDWVNVPTLILSEDIASTFRNLAQAAGGSTTIKGLPGTWFMERYYPDVWAMGVQLHLGVIGEAYLLGGPAGLLGLCVALGFLSWVLDAAFASSSKASVRLFCIIIATWMFAIGWNLVDSLQKILVIVLGPALWIGATTAFGRHYLRRSTRRE